MTSELITTLAASLLSLLASYLPGFSTWYEGQSGAAKRLVMLGLLLLVVILIFASACAGLADSVTCDQPGAWGLLRLFFYALVSNQATYLISPPKKASHAQPSDPSFSG